MTVVANDSPRIEIDSLTAGGIIEDGAKERFTRGVEVGGSDFFFSLDGENGFGCETEERLVSVKAGEASARLIVEVPGGRFELIIHEELLSASSLRRAIELKARSEISLMDFVVRQCFRSCSFNRAEVGGREHQHKAKNVWHQYEANMVELYNGSLRVQVESQARLGPDEWHHVMYARDEPGKWVVHDRLLPKEKASSKQNVVLKICHQYWGTRVVPERIARFVLEDPGRLNRYLYRAEQNRDELIDRVLGLSAYPIGRLENNESLKSTVDIKLV